MGSNRQLTDDERERLALPLLAEIRRRIVELSAGDTRLAWALRRKIYKELVYDERSKPMTRVKLKKEKRAAQKGTCAACNEPLPAKGAVLDRFEAEGGYTPENTRLICPPCDMRIQAERRYS